MRKYIVYEHKSPSGKVYVGITCQKIQHRWKGGSGYVRQDKHQEKFANAIRKYGWDNIEHRIVLEGISRSEADYAERYLIKWYKLHGLSYNITDGGDGGLGTKHTEETKKRLSELHKGRKMKTESVIKGINTRIDNYDYYIIAVNAEGIQIFRTAKEAAEKLGIKHRGNISACIAQKQCFVNGYVFMHWSKSIPINENCIYQWYNFRVNNRYSSERKVKYE